MRDVNASAMLLIELRIGVNSSNRVAVGELRSSRRPLDTAFACAVTVVAMSLTLRAMPRVSHRATATMTNVTANSVPITIRRFSTTAANA